MKNLKRYFIESVKPENGKDWEVYIGGTLDTNFTIISSERYNIFSVVYE